MNETAILKPSEPSGLRPANRPLVPIRTAMFLADLGEDAVLDLIENGTLPWAWDISGAYSIRRDIRIWRPCLMAWLKNPATYATLTPRAALDEAEVYRQLFTHSREKLRGTEVRRIFSCCHSHIGNLIRAGLLTATTEIRTGPNGSPKITRLSIINFLRSRRVT